MNSKLTIIDVQGTKYEKFISDNIINKPDEEVTYIQNGKSLMTIEKILLENEDIIALKYSEMDEEDIEDCVNTLVIIDNIKVEMENISTIIDNASEVYLIAEFGICEMTEKYAEYLLELMEVYEYDDVNNTIRENILVLKDGEMLQELNTKKYVIINEVDGELPLDSISIDEEERFKEVKNHGEEKSESKINSNESNSQEFTENDIFYDSDNSEKTEKNVDKNTDNFFVRNIKKLCRYIVDQFKIVFNLTKENSSLKKRLWIFVKCMLILLLVVSVSVILLIILMYYYIFKLLIKVIVWQKNRKK